MATPGAANPSGAEQATTPWSPRVTVAAVVERDGRFLMVEELIDGRRVWNQPAGHLDPDESLQTAVVREAREETGYRFVPESLVGIYLWQLGDGPTFLRHAFAGRVEGEPSGTLDVEIVAVHWRTRAELAAPDAPLRSPLVLRCVDDFLAGRRYATDVLQTVGIPAESGR
jgi:8-oxo-dGTP pyrophosphatase MutT (NUDIX family)